MPKNSPFFIKLGPGLSTMVGLPIIVSWTTAKRPKNPQLGTFGFNTQTNSLEFWDGTNWHVAAMRKK